MVQSEIRWVGRSSQDRVAWKQWLQQHQHVLLHDCGLPISILEAERTWLYFLEHGYAEEPIAFDVDSLTVAQLQAFQRLLAEELLPHHAPSGAFVARDVERALRSINQ